MSGRDLVRGVRDAAPIPKNNDRRGSIVDLVVVALAVIAVGSFAYFGYITWFGPHAPRLQAAPPAHAASAEPLPVWTDEDTSHCKANARAVADDPMPGGALLVNRAVTDGFGPMATLIECRITTKVTRFCNPKGKAELVEIINDYLGRVDLIRLGLGVEGAPMAVLGEMFGGEIAAGDSIHDLQNEGTFAFMKVYHDRIAMALRTLGRKGIVTVSDFGTFFGTGVPSSISDIFKGVVVEESACPLA